MSDSGLGNAPKRSNGWETADKVAHGAGAAINGLAILLMKGWAVLLIIGGIWFMTLGAGGIWAGLAVVAYGVYLILPGSKFVVW